MMWRLVITVDVDASTVELEDDLSVDDAITVANLLVHPDLPAFIAAGDFRLDWCCAEGEITGRFVSAEWAT